MGVTVTPAAGVLVGVGVGNPVFVGVTVFVGVLLGVAVFVTPGVGVLVAVADGVVVGVASGTGKTKTYSPISWLYLTPFSNTIGPMLEIFPTSQVSG